MNKKNYTKEDKKRGARLKAMRQKYNYTQESMAEILNVSVSMIKKLESGENNISLSILKRLKNEFNVSSDFILFGEVKNDKYLEYEFESVSGEEKMKIFMRILIILCREEGDKFVKVMERIMTDTCGDK